nr:methyl-accepting chemotaxis protein [Achromobacter insuavis]
MAQRSAQAAREVKDLIEQSSSNVDSGAEQVRAAGDTMQEIVDSVQRVTLIMAEITEASTEQSIGIDQINGAVTQMDDVTQQNAALVEQAAAAASSLEEQAKRLAATAAFFKLPAETVIDVTPQAIAAPLRPAYVA